MLKLSKLTDYALVVLDCLGAQNGRPVSASYVSEKTKLPEPTVQKVLKLMASKKIITALRGANGGYIVPLSLACISIADVVEAIEGPLQLAPCDNDTGNDCSLAKLYAPQKRWNKVNLAIKQTLDKIRVSELVQNGATNDISSVKEKAL
jgi:FeS assembly SUF system regulator